MRQRLVSGLSTPNYREKGFEAISLLRIATEAARLLGRQTLPQSVSICFEKQMICPLRCAWRCAAVKKSSGLSSLSCIDLEKTDHESAQVSFLES
jgi:hypothetical protein